MKIIEFKNVTKDYFQRDDRTFKELIPNLFFGKSWAKKHQVFKNLSFHINKGETVGIIGRNGAGKSTLLKLIAGVTFPNSGKVLIHGSVAPLIELGAGFHHELTGRENIFLNAALLGMQKKEIASTLDEIISFSDLGDYIDVPIKRYSSGMYMRLGFSIAIHTKSPILLIDEVLAVGDAAFRKKCLKKLEQLRTEGKRTIVFVSHDDTAVAAFCQRCLLLNDGEIIFDGTPHEALMKYHQLVDSL